MRHENRYSEERRQAENDLAEIKSHLNNKKITSDPEKHHMLIDARDKVVNTLEKLDRMENSRPYSDTNIGYNSQPQQRMDDYNDMRTMADDVMDAINKILPQISNDMDYADNMEMRRGVPGTGRGRYRKRTRVRGYTRRADMDDMANMADMNDNARSYAYNDAYNDDYNDAYSNAYNNNANANNNNMRSNTNNDQRMHDAVARAAAETAAATARHMTANMYSANNVYPSTPVMPYSNANNYNADANYNRSNDATSDTRNIGPGARM